MAGNGHLNGCFRLFRPKVLGGGGDLRMMVLLKNECILSCGDTQPLLSVKKFELFALSTSGDAKTLNASTFLTGKLKNSKLEVPNQSKIRDIWQPNLDQCSFTLI